MSYTKVLLRAGFVVAPVVAVSVGLVPAAQARTGPPAQRALTTAQAKALSTHVSDKVIVVFNNQVSAIPDTATNQAVRSSAVRQVQRSVLSELTATHARSVKSLSLINAVSATVSAGEARRLQANPAVAEVVKDEPIPLVGSSPKEPLTPKAGGFKAPPKSCPAKGGVQLNPQAIETIHAAGQNNSGKTAEKLGYTGAGVKVAFIADGVDPNNPDFIRANGKHVFVDYEDFSGTGTSAPTGGGEAFLDSSSIAAQGRHVYNVNSYGTGLNDAVQHQDPRRCPRRQPGRAECVRFGGGGLQLGVPRGDQLRRQRRPRQRPQRVVRSQPVPGQGQPGPDQDGRQRRSRRPA